MSPSPVTSVLKRKAGEEGEESAFEHFQLLLMRFGIDVMCGSKSEDKENANIEKKAKVDASSNTSLVELKGRKLIFKQEALSRKLPRRQLLNFEGWLLDEVEAGKKITEVPEEFWGLIVMAGHELSSSNESLFVKNLKSALDVVKSGQDPLPNEAVIPLIPKLFTLKQYGFLPSDFSPSTSTVKIPAALQIRSWEANDLEQHFPADQIDELITRTRMREQAREDCLRILDGLDDIEKIELIKGDKDKGKDVKEVKEIKDKVVKEDLVPESPRVDSRKSREGTANTVDSSRRSASPTKKTKMTPEEEEAARLRKEEKEAKKAEIVEKRAAKEREKERRDALVAKQQRTMMGFFKTKPPTPLISRASPAGPSSLKGDDVSPVKSKGSDYARTFRLMPQRPHVHIAEMNRWVPKRELDSGEGSSKASSTSEVDSWQANDFIDEHLRRHGKSTRSSRRHLIKGLKIIPPHGTVADVYSTLEDAEDPRAVLSQLKDRNKFPWKVLAFDQQTRPPYCGTFTKKSVVVGPRTPFAQDPIFDYSYDSSDDWVDDEGGEDVDDFGEGEPKEDEEDEDDDEDEGEFDDWLDDAEDVDFTPVEGESTPQAEPEQARLPMKVVKKSREVPKKVVKLTPSWKGPVWESIIGEEGTNGLEGYRIQLLNETPHSIDPFTFKSDEPEQRFKASFSSTVIGATLNVRCLLSVEAIFTPSAPPVPEKPKSVPNSSSIDSKPIYASTSSTAVNGDVTPQSRSRAAGPKVGFPETHVAELYQLIEGSKKIKPDLVSQLRESFENIATKAAIEAKLKEVAVREGKTKDSQWKVKPEAWIAIGMTPPTPTPTPTPVPAPTIVPVPATKPVTSFFSSPTPTSAPPSQTNGTKEKSLAGTIDEPMIIDA
ncbi:uncharacterized protein IL334_002633 [Kwoniella shivajii]|uniref:Chromatin assembly factor 1 subunit A n=1 Tax=Kwoniella shivajii TaxID=564305 RepID=A0ABZ1CVB4_9TREE|nr:hypothetical protein IL334_002633 [Kwoniella shivajii]